VSAAEPIVFVVDDDSSVCRSLGRLLRSAGFRVEAFASAEEFLQRERNGARACLVVDVRMPGMSGPDLVDHLAIDGWSLPAIFITAHDDPHMRSRAIAAGAVAYLRKPFEGRALLDAVNAALAGGLRHQSGL